MKTVFILVVSVLLLANVSGSAQRKMETQDLIAHSGYSQDEKTKIKKEELPATAQKTLEGDAFKGWSVENVYKLKNGEFEVELKKSGTAQTVKFDKDGKMKNE